MRVQWISRLLCTRIPFSQWDSLTPSFAPFFFSPFTGVFFLRRLCTSLPNSRVKDYRSAKAWLIVRYSISRKTFGALSASDNKPAAFGEIDSAANEFRLFIRTIALTVWWRRTDMKRSFFFLTKKACCVCLIFSLDVWNFKASQVTKDTIILTQWKLFSCVSKIDLTKM